MAPLESVVSSMRGMNGSRRFLILGGLAAVVVVIWAVASWASRPTFVPLYRDLDLEQAASIQDQLTRAKIPVQLGGGGTEVLVPLAELARARVALAKSGTGTGRPGLELFDKPSWGMTDFTQRVTYQRALEGELARTIGGLQGVRRAQVHLVLPTNSPIRRLERPAAASVVLTLDAGRGLSSEAIQGISYIVSNSVEQLSPENIAIMDDAGRVLSVPSSAGPAAGLTTRQMDIQHSVEEHLADKVSDLLATVLGPGRVRTQVSAQLSFDQVDRTIESFDPDGAVLQNEQRSEDPSGQASTPTVFNNTYQNSRRLEKIVSTGGNITRLTVAVLVDERALGGQAASRKDSLAAMVRDVVGLDSTRGDRVTVMAVPFEAVAVAGVDSVPGGDSDRPAPSPVGLLEQWSRPLLALVAILVLLLIAWRALRPGAWTPPAQLPAAMGSPEGGTLAAEGAPQAGSPELAAHAASIQMPPPGRPFLEPLPRPELGVKVIRSWLAES